MEDWFFSPFKPKSKKQHKNEQLRSNVQKGRRAEEMAMFNAMIQGKEVERTGRGHDFVTRERDLFNGRVRRTEYHEVKSGGAELSKLQRKMKKKKGSSYKVDRYDDFLF
jgi:hypothetical protein